MCSLLVAPFVKCITVGIFANSNSQTDTQGTQKYIKNIKILKILEFELIYYHYSYFVAQRDAIDQIFVNVGSCQSSYEDTNKFYDNKMFYLGTILNDPLLLSLP